MKKMILKRLFGVVAMLGCVVSLASCKNDEEIDYGHTIYFYSNQGQDLQAITNLAISQFKKAYPEWDVKHEIFSNYDEVQTKVLADLKVGAQPDLAYCYPDHVANYMQSSVVADLKNLVTEADLAKIEESYLEESYGRNFGECALYGYDDDSIMVLPFLKSTEAMFYNKTIVDEFGGPATTWEELWEQAAAIKADPRYANMTVLGYDSDANWFINMCKQNGLDYTSASTPHYKFATDDHAEWLEDIRGYYNDGYIVTAQTNATRGGYTSDLFKKGTNGGCVYCIGSTGGATYQFTDSFEVSCCPTPSSHTGEGNPTDDERAVISQGPDLVVLKTSRSSNVDEKVQMTYKFLRDYLYQPKYQMMYSLSNGYAPVIKAAYEQEYNETGMSYGEYIDSVNFGDAASSSAELKVMALKATKETAPYQYTSPAFPNSSKPRQILDDVMFNAMKGSNDTLQILQKAVRDCGGQ